MQIGQWTKRRQRIRKRHAHTSSTSNIHTRRADAITESHGDNLAYPSAVSLLVVQEQEEPDRSVDVIGGMVGTASDNLLIPHGEDALTLRHPYGTM